MRQIEEEMMDAIANNDCWSKSNTAVIHNDMTGLMMVYLHGHHIASGSVMATGNRVWHINYDTLRDWPTRTTMSRLRALGFDVYTRKGVVYHEGRVV